MWWFPSYPARPILVETVGRHYKRKAETLTWELVTLTEDTARLRGPGLYGKGFMTLERTEFQRDWVAA